MIALLASLWLASASAAPPAETLALADAPLSAPRRLDVARSLLARPGWGEAGVAALARLLDDPEAGAGARAALVDLLGRSDAQPRWETVYASLLEAPAFEGRDRIVLRLAELRLREPRTHASALAELERISTLATPETNRLIGRALLRGGEPRRAASAFGRVGDAPGQAQEALAALAANDLARARTLADLGANPPGLLDALRDPTPLTRASALAANGYTGMARELLEAAPSEVGGARLAELYRVEGKLPEATAALLTWRRAHPDDDAARRALIDVYVARQRYADARKLYAEGDPAAAALTPLVDFRKAWESRSKKAMADTLEAAWLAAPQDPFVAREWAKSKLDARSPQDALPALGALLDIHPTDSEALGLYNLAAMSAGTSGSAVRRQLAAAEAETRPKAWAERLASAADLLAMQAEEIKKGGDAVAAIDPYFIGLLLDAPDAGQLLGAGGLLWQAQHLEGAEALYAEALRQSPRNADALMGTVRLLLQLGREDEALRVIESSTSRDSRVKLLHVTVLNALRAREARAAQRAGDLETARVIWKQLAEQYPDQADFRHGLGDALAGLGEFEDALVQYRAALELAPTDSWAALGEANCLIALARPEEARERLGAVYPTGADAVADGEKVHVVARSWRVTAAREQAAGATLEAFAAWREAFEMDPEIWSIDGLASMYLQQEQPEVALAFSEEALSLDPQNESAIVGRAMALADLGRWDDARAAAEQIKREGASPKALSARIDLLQRLAVQQAEYQRRMGDVSGAIERLTAIIKAEGDTSDLWTALTGAHLDNHDCPRAMDTIGRALTADPRSRWALGTALRTESVCKTADAIYPKLQEADRRAGGGFAAAELRASRFELDLQKAEKYAAEGKKKEALTPLREAQAMGELTADEWARLGGVWLALARPNDALDAFHHTLAIDPTHVPAIIGIAGAYRADARLGAAEEHLTEAWGRVRDPRVGLQLVQTLLQRGKYQAAADRLADVRTATLPPEPAAPESDRPDPLPVLPLPSGRVPGPRTWAPVPPRDLQPRWLVDAVDAVDIDLARERGVQVMVGGGVFAKPGDAGEQKLDGWYVPAQIIFPPIGLFRPNADVVLVHLTDGVGEAIGVAPAVGLATPPFRKFFATARVGTTPLGFEKTNVLWHGHARFGLLPNLAIGAVSARTPKSDSFLSWAGSTDAATGTFYGFVSELWLAGYASWTPAPFDLGGQLKGGYTEGYGVLPNSFGEVVLWGGGRLGGEKANLHLGGQVVGITNERQEDSFELGHGGYFSPPVFVMAVAEARGQLRVAGNRGRVCASLSGGPQYVDGVDTDWFGAGWSATARAGLGGSWRVATRWAVGLDGRAQLSTSGWHQEAALAHVTYGLTPQGPSAPSLATTASAGSIVLATDDLCSVE